MVTDYSDVKLETKDLILKKAEFEDWKTIYYNLWRHKESAKYMLWQPTETDEDAKDRMKRTIAFEEKPENKYALFVYLKKTVKQSVLQACANWNGAFMKRQVLHLDRNLCEKVTGDRYLRHFLRRQENWEQKNSMPATGRAMLLPESYSCHVDLYSIRCQKRRQIREQAKRIF